MLLLVVHALLAWAGRAPGILTRQDDSRYLLLARALRHGTYRDLMWPGAPYHHMYPPGYPLLLAAWGALGGDRFGWLVLLQIALSVGALALAFDAARRAAGDTVALCALTILAVNPELLSWSGQIASEGALAFCFAAAVWGATALRPGRRQVVVVLAAALAAPLMRTAGVVLPAAVVVAWLLERRYRDALVAALASAVVVVPLLVWTMRDPTLVPGSSYAADLVAAPGGQVVAGGAASMWSVLARRIAVNAMFYPTQAVPWLLPLPTVPGTIVDNVVGASLVVLALVAGVVRERRALLLGILALLASAALLLVWPYHVARYVAPLLPLLVPLLVAGAAGLGAAVGRARGATVAAAMATLVVAGTGVARTSAGITAAARCARDGAPLPDTRCLAADEASFFDAARFVRDSLPADARILSAKSEPLHLYAGRPTAPASVVVRLDSASFWRALGGMGVDYVLLGALQEDERPLLARHLAERCATLQLVRSFPPHTYLFRLPARGDTTATTRALPPPTEPPGCAALRAYERETVPIVSRERERDQSAADTSTRLS
ncbi:MAG TPA: glycosyltransferase family 39 protein [Gemmatimonadaceae bacterium]|nr:glycosyltransferase family 39 protein [Gemmatimonadaceae bacterium]